MVYDFLRRCKSFVLFPYREKAYQYMIKYAAERPLDINVETTTICPMKCKFCCNRIYHRDKIIMSIDMFESIVKEYINIGGGTIGISAMHSDSFSDPLIYERFRIIANYKEALWVHTTTPLITAARLSDEELTCILSNLDFLEVSVEGYDRESYENLSGVDGFDVLMSQLHRVKKIIQEHNLQVDVAMAFRTYDKNKLMLSDTYKELISMFRYGGVVDSFFSWFGSIKLSDLPKGASLHVSDNRNKTEDCVVPHATLSIEANGNVVGCACIDWLQSFTIGNVNDNSLLDIWRSPKAVAFRNAFSLKEIPKICQECGLYCSVAIFRNTCLKNYNSKQGLYYWVAGRNPGILDGIKTYIKRFLQ